eukprot:scaffold11354_cov56-Attheya_sp.AAC.1
MAIAIHPHSDPRNHSTCLYLVYLLIHVLKVFDGLVADLLMENTMRVAWLFLGAGYGLSLGYDMSVWVGVVSVLTSVFVLGGCSISVAGGFYVLEEPCIFILLCVWSLVVVNGDLDMRITSAEVFGWMTTNGFVHKFFNDTGQAT